MSGSFQCPYCQFMNVKSFRNDEQKEVEMFDSSMGHARITIDQKLCINPECRKLSVQAVLDQVTFWNSGDERSRETLHSWSLLPNSKAKPQPDYIPRAIVNDYEEACAIVELSPKASATLSRRCIQGMIRDFYGVKARTLFDEIEAITDKIDPVVKTSIDAVRNIGNIGAHMEKDIDLIIDVEPHEAELLIALIEQLLGEWYGNRYRRQENMIAIQAAALGKAALKAPALDPEVIEINQEPMLPSSE